MQEKKIKANQLPEMEILSSEAHLFHVELLKRENDPAKKEYVDRKVIQKFAPNEFKLMKDIKFFASYDKVTIIHNPELQGPPVTSDPEALKALIEEYTELFGKAPVGNMKMETLLFKVAFEKLSQEYQIKFGQEVPAAIKTVDELTFELSKEVPTSF